MPDIVVLVSEVTASAIASLMIVLAALSLRHRPRAWLATLGTVLLLAAVAIVPLDLPWDGALNIVGYALVLSAYPDGRVPWRWLWAPLTAYLALAVVLLAAGDAVLTTPWWTAAAGTELLLIGVALHRYRRRLSTDERERVRWALLGVLVTFGGMLTLTAVALTTGAGTIAGLGPVGLVSATVFGAMLPVCLAVGLVRPGLLPVDEALRVVLTILLCGVPLAGLYAISSRFPGGWWGTALVVLAAVPLAPLAARIADRIVFQGRLSPDAAARLLSDRLSAEGSAEDAPLVLAETAVEALRLAHASVAGPGLRSASAGEAPATEHRTASYRGEEVGTLAVAPRRGETSLTRRDRAVVAELARRAAPALHGARAVTQLVASRAGELRAHEEERKRLRRDLHDELAPTLVGLSLSASGIARMLRDEGHVLAGPTAQLADDAQTAIGQTRALAYGLRPPTLDRHGLVAAVREKARSTDVLRIRVDAPDDPLELPAAVEVAALRIVQEAVTNVRRHSGARRCDVRIDVDDDRLHLEIEDDGSGLPVAPSAGLGLDSMRDRARELGGTLRLTAARDGGLLVSATLPLGGAV